MRAVCLRFFLTLSLCGQSRAPVYSVQTADGVDLFDGDGLKLRSLRLDMKAIEQVAFDRSGTYGVGVSGRCSDKSPVDGFEFAPGRPRRRFAISSRLPYPPEADEKEIITGLAISPSGRKLAFTTIGCWESLRDTSQGPGVLAIRERGAGTVRVLAGSLDPEGIPLGFAYSPAWSDDEQMLLMGYDSAFRVLRVADGSVLAESPPLHEGYLQPIGWIGPRCVVYVRGKDIDDAPRQESKVFQVVTKQVRMMSEVAGVAAGRVRPSEIRWPFAISRGEDGVTLHRLDRTGKSTRVRGGAASILPVAPIGDLPVFCR